MSETDVRGALLRALDRARPGAFVSTLNDVLSEYLGARRVSLLLVDYQLTRLRPINDPDNYLLLDGGDAGRAFTTQSPVVSTAEGGQEDVYLPVSVHGDRMGVLRLTLSVPLDADRLDELAALAMLTGYALSATSRHTDFLHRTARTRRLTLAAELQRQLLPARGCLAPEYELAGLLEPAYAAYADNFDWSEDGNELLISITDGTHHARNYPLLTTLAVTALRNARRAGFEIAEQFALADEVIYAHHQGNPYVNALAASIDITTGHARAIKAGSPQIVLLRHDEIHTINLTDQMPLGMFEGTEYDEQSFDLATGDRLLLLSDGVLDAVSPRGEPYRDSRLHSMLSTIDHHSPTAVVRAIIDDLIEHHDDNELDDDATAVCLDWTGPGESSTHRLSEPDERALGTKRHLRSVPHADDIDDQPRQTET